MTFNEWINKIIDSGYLCMEYTDKVHEAESKRAIIDIVLDNNGSKFLCEMDEHGMPLPYATLLGEFGDYLNGKYNVEFDETSSGGSKYTSSLWCCYDEPICRLETTLCTMLGCKTTVIIPENTVVRIIADKNCELTINIPETSKCKVDYSAGGKINAVGCVENIRVRKRKPYKKDRN